MKKWYAVIGDPIAQSMSPTMHNEWFQQLNIDATYIPIHVRENELSEAIRSLRLLGCSGFNVTVPHKEAIIPLLDDIDTTASKMGAVNTVVVEEGRLIGYNTDGLGFVASLEENEPHLQKDVSLLMIGAGGAAKGIAHALQASGYQQLTIANRTIERAEQLAKTIGVQSCTIAEAEKQLANFDVIVQTTSVGMNFGIAGSPLALTQLKPGTVIADIIYNPLTTVCMAEGQRMGARTMNGVGMFVHQGAIAFEYWTGKQPPTEQTVQRIVEQLGGKTC